MFSSMFSLALPFAATRIVAPYKNVWRNCGLCESRLVSLNDAMSVKSSFGGFLLVLISGQEVSCFCPDRNESSEVVLARSDRWT